MLYIPSLSGLFFVLVLGSFNVVEAETFTGSTSLKSKTYEQLTLYGPSDLQDIKATSLSVEGPLTFQKLEISGKASVNGPVKGDEGKFDQLVIRGPFEAKNIKGRTLDTWGPVSLTDANITGNVKITGPLKAKRSQFKDIAVAGSSSLEDVSVDNITFNKDKTLTLSGKTIVSGNITFESGNGEVIVKGDNVIIKGQIKGGELKK